MKMNVLVAYASKHDATAEIATKIGQTIQDSGFDVDIRPVDQVENPDSYDVIVLGSAVYIGGWQKKAAVFLKTYEKILAEKIVWLFSSGPTGKGEPVELLEGWRFPKSLQPMADRIKPRDIAVFHGVLDHNDLNFIEKFAAKKVKAPIGDFREWDEITSWAKAIAETIKKPDGM